MQRNSLSCVNRSDCYGQSLYFSSSCCLVHLPVLAFGDLDMHPWRNASYASSVWHPVPIKSRRLLFRFTAHARITGAVHSEYTPGSRQKAEQWTLHRLSGDRLESLSGPPVVTVQKEAHRISAGSTHSLNFCWNAVAASPSTLIDRIESAVDAYPYAYRYRVWPGPNSNSFTAFVARKVPNWVWTCPLRRLERIFLQKVS